jgi:branched-subunit amino acid transport protein
MIGLWLTLIAIGVISFAYRFSFILFLEYIQLPNWLNRTLRFVPVAALTAITVPELLVYSGQFDFTWQNERLLAGALAALIAWRTHNIFLTIGLGMACLYALQWVGM